MQMRMIVVSWFWVDGSALQCCMRIDSQLRDPETSGINNLAGPPRTPSSLASLCAERPNKGLKPKYLPSTTSRNRR